MKPSTLTHRAGPPGVTFARELVFGEFERRLNRFLACVRVGGERAAAHVPNTGRMGELLVDGAEVALEPKGQGARKCPYDLVLVRTGGAWVCVDSRLANDVFEAVLRSLRGPDPFDHGGELPPLVSRALGHRREVSYGRRRFDFELDLGGEAALVEVKSVNLVEGGAALFPDAPTERGAHHLELMAALRRNGRQCMVAFVVMRADAQRFEPNGRVDPRFASALREAYRAGVEVVALGCEASPLGLFPRRILPVVL